MLTKDNINLKVIHHRLILLENPSLKKVELLLNKEEEEQWNRVKIYITILITKVGLLMKVYSFKKMIHI